MPAKDGGAKGGTNDKAEKESPLATDNSESDEGELASWWWLDALCFLA